MAFSRWLAPAVLAAALGAASFAPAPAHAQSIDSLTQAIVNIADVAFRGGQPYYRNGDYSADDRLIMRRDAYGRPVYYRLVRADGYNGNYNGYNSYNAYNGYNNAYRSGYTAPPYGRAYGYRGQAPGHVKCNKHGKCKTEYYDARYDRRDRDDDRYRQYGYSSRYDRDDD